MGNIAKCPVCNQGDLIAGKNGYMCNHFKNINDKCSFHVFKNYYGKEITHDTVKQLSDKQETDLFDDLISKDGKVFSAKLFILNGKIRPKFEKNELLSPCPKCKKKVYVTNNSFACEDYFNEKVCDFYFNKKVAEIEITSNDAEILLNGSSTDFRTDFLSTSKKEFGAKLILDENFRVKFDFEIVKCPKCKSGIVSSNHWAYGCSNFKNESIKCEFTVWREVLGKQITITDFLDLCHKGFTESRKFKQKHGEDYTGYFKLDENFKLQIVTVS
uniref:topoisomerase C-terminal repeat-containing protein n=1 Tax=Pedobacter sp. TaxID=1411316 RepID=UPI00159A4C32|nr:topoisomerase C-terminal repeat-containing protein [Pedobacter sp.]QJS06257.1 DNA topoisomerase I [Pedobacter sp.]